MYRGMYVYVSIRIVCFREKISQKIRIEWNFSNEEIFIKDGRIIRTFGVLIYFTHEGVDTYGERWLT